MSLQYTPIGPLAEARLDPDAVKVAGRSRAILSLQVLPHLHAGTLVLLQPAVESLLGDNPILQEIQPDGSLSVLADNKETTKFKLAPEALV